MPKKQIGIEKMGSMPNKVKSQNEPNMPSIRKSPWAKFTMFMTPQMSVSPMATSEYTKPISKPSASCCIN